MFTKEQRGTFKYWWAHWCAYQLTALNLGCWKFRFLMHDVWKPFMMLIFNKDYFRVQSIHRNYAKHHVTYWVNRNFSDRAFIKLDILGMVIDWECSRLTKADAQMDVRKTLEYTVQKLKKEPYYDIKGYPHYITDKQLQRFESSIHLTIEQLGL